MFALDVTVNVYETKPSGRRCQLDRQSAMGIGDSKIAGRADLTGIRDLARHLDISIGTVSRALNDKADVNPETRERVREAAAKLGYSPNQSGRSLRRGAAVLRGDHRGVCFSGSWSS